MPRRTKDTRFSAENGLSFTQGGHLPTGIHDCSLAGLRPLVCTNDYRRRLWPRLIAFLSWAAIKGQFSRAYVGGGFVSQKSDPHDIDVILETIEPYGPQSFAALCPFFSVGLERILSMYSIHLQFWIKDSPAGVSDYRTFFQYAQPKRQLELFPAQRGIVRIDLLDPDIVPHLHDAFYHELIKSAPKIRPDQPRGNLQHDGTREGGDQNRP